MEGFLTIVIIALLAGGAGVWFGYGRGCVVGVESVLLGYESVILEHTEKKRLRHLRVPDEHGLALGRKMGERYRDVISRMAEVADPPPKSH